MADEEAAALKGARGSLVASGFPFQMAIAQLVSRRATAAVTAEEVPWRDHAGQDRFIDLIVAKYRLRLVIECKKTQKKVLTFLQSRSAASEVEDVRCVYLEQIQDSTRRWELYCRTWYLLPPSRRAKFCVVSGDPLHRMLERDAQQLVRAAEAYAQQQRPGFEDHAEEKSVLFLPVVVTNARLFVAKCSADAVSLETGELPERDPALFEAIQWIRFDKAFTPGPPDRGAQTVFVVNALHFDDFLAKLTLPTAPRPVPDDRVYIPKPLP